MVFHAAGDTGGVKRPEVQALVARGMEQDYAAASEKPAFFYHLGDVVYYNGLVRDYFAQFYEPYEHYPCPIVGIGGNHDGDKFEVATSSLEGFYRNFCADAGTYTPESRDTGRMAMCQPYVYWSFDTPFAYFIGLYTNVPEGGELDQTQRDWFRSEMAAAPKDKALMLALHHPIYSFDNFHSGSPKMALEVEQAINESRRVPNVILTAHVHNYQRIEVETGGIRLPFLVIGNGGYWHLHRLSVNVGHRDHETGAMLVAGTDDRHGFATLDIGPRFLNGRFTTVPRPHESWSDPNNYNARCDVFSYSAEPMTLAAGKAVKLSAP
jgi:acid phosphatase type 7